MIRLLRKIHWCYFQLSMLVFFLLFLPFYYVFSRKPAYYRFLNIFRKLHAFFGTAVTGMFFRFEYAEKLDPRQTYIFCANHTSNLDILLFCLVAKGPFHFMGKEELLQHPIFRIFFKTIDIPVMRESKISSFRAFLRAGENLEKGMSLIIFPEGRIDGKYPPELQEFKNGPFRLAIEKKIPIVPVSSINVWKIFWDDGKKYGTRPGIGNIYIHEPIITRILDVENADELKERVFDKILTKL